jgi:hypothetical protein
LEYSSSTPIQLRCRQLVCTQTLAAKRSIFVYTGSALSAAV